MANRTYNQFGGTLERKVVKLFAKIEYVSGAPVLVTSEVLNSGTSPITINPSQGFESLSDDGAGVFTLVLGASNGGVPTYDPYVRLLGLCVCDVGVLAMTSVIGSTVTNDNVNGAAGNPSLQISLLTGSGGGVDPADGTVLLVEVTLSNTTAY
jgi:hypothetical protein